ncbi:uncharacterized protein [Arachis hypogaea]|uniref:uncharacterized protein n=1 Tax=Arachis hypogaea TaxID=3818 RepID=UPI000DEC8169|nr:uncharacterized protein LOC112727875 [Arachis hypogaea]QHO24617.1 uncharacterized protein DS421_12g373760 [Arachis hypogaea]
MEKLVASLPAESQKLGLEDKSNGTEYRSRCAAVMEAGAKEKEWKGKRTKEEEKAENWGRLPKRRRFCLQGLIYPITKCSMPPGLRYGHLSATSASSSFSVQCKRLNSTEGHKCPRFFRGQRLECIFHSLRTKMSAKKMSGTKMSFTHIIMKYHIHGILACDVSN